MALGTTGGSFKSISEEDIVTRRSALNQLVDVIQEDISGSITRRKYQVFVTGGIGPGVTSSLFQTVYDQDFTLQTANPILDLTVGLFNESPLVIESSLGDPINGKLLFPSQSLMMREKVDVYKQYAANLLGNSDAAFFAPIGSSNTDEINRFDNDRIDEALFISFKRLFSRDRIKRETFAMRTYRSGAIVNDNPLLPSPLNLTSEKDSVILTDLGAASNITSLFGGEVGNIVNANNTAETLGLIFYEHGTIVLDMGKLYDSDQILTGHIDAMNDVTPGKTFMNSPFSKFLASGSIDNIVDHLAASRFQSGSLTGMTFQNVTNINSTLIFCRASADEFNYSTNPTYKDENGRIRVIDAGQEDVQRSFTFVTTIGLHDDEGRMLAVAKTSRPVEKSDERDITFRVRLDF
jgi:hypothetical protein